MKALICIPCLLTGGTEIQTLNTVQALVQGGHGVTVACYFEHTPDMVARYRKAGANVVLFSPDGTRPTGFRTIIFLYRHLRRIVKQLRPNVTHVQYMAPGATVILLLWFMGVKNIITTAHTAADIYKDLRLIHFIQRHCVRAFTCITELAEKSFFGTSQLYTPETKLKKRNHFTIHNCLTRNEERGTRNGQKPCLSSLNVNRSTFNVQRFTLGVVSRLETIKGMDLVVPAFAEVLKQHPDTRLVVVGDGSLRSAMEQQVIELRCNDKITWAGRQPQEELNKWYSQMDIVLMPSRSEGFGLTAIEAMANGCVVVASNIGGLPEVVHDKICGLLHRSEDTTDMADKISSLISNEATYNQLRTQSLHEVEKYSFERYAELINDMYEKCKV
ncbi:MAG: glycosyltransferase family 4 protein [Bacteroidaceae bacterium]|nr:glycosyltransferase family 4 protein [Bacteroidaceae bacterium]